MTLAQSDARMYEMKLKGKKEREERERDLLPPHEPVDGPRRKSHHVRVGASTASTNRAPSPWTP